MLQLLASSISASISHLVFMSMGSCLLLRLDASLFFFAGVALAQGHTRVEKREEHVERKAIWQIAARRSIYSTLPKRSLIYKGKQHIERTKAQARAKAEHPFRISKRQFSYVKTRFCGLVKNTAQLTNLFALSNLRMAQKHVMSMGELRV